MMPPISVEEYTGMLLGGRERESQGRESVGMRERERLRDDPALLAMMDRYRGRGPSHSPEREADRHRHSMDQFSAGRRESVESLHSRVPSTAPLRPSRRPPSLPLSIHPALQRDSSTHRDRERGNGVPSLQRAMGTSNHPSRPMSVSHITGGDTVDRRDMGERVPPQRPTRRPPVSPSPSIHVSVPRGDIEGERYRRSVYGQEEAVRDGERERDEAVRERTVMHHTVSSLEGGGERGGERRSASRSLDRTPPPAAALSLPRPPALSLSQILSPAVGVEREYRHSESRGERERERSNTVDREARASRERERQREDGEYQSMYKSHRQTLKERGAYILATSRAIPHTQAGSPSTARGTARSESENDGVGVTTKRPVPRPRASVYMPLTQRYRAAVTQSGVGVGAVDGEAEASDRLDSISPADRLRHQISTYKAELSRYRSMLPLLAEQSIQYMQDPSNALDVYAVHCALVTEYRDRHNEYITLMSDIRSRISSLATMVGTPETQEGERETLQSVLRRVSWLSVSRG
ncbi:hypothetical protein KIPB_008977 [Kipferlia bialata]|uniref:OCEL domain-containing protein n=1 Tax=Kipferlia bialata TaxID=797122 RepID=A0A9K3D2I3_9EUKA|nr:hypothetical protein KIPB_008977 [Kipferlia bialata]|eukprot:g8977.t1